MPSKKSTIVVAPRHTSKRAMQAAPEPEPMKPDVHPRVSFIRSVRFVGLGLDRCDARVDRVNLAIARKDDLELEHFVNLKQFVLAHEDDHFVVGLDFELIQRPLKSEVKIVTINAAFSGRFNLAMKASEDHVRAFANLEAKLIFFPYVRHLVSDLSYRMSIDPIVLPMTSELENHKSPA